jgi:hypothetical protein
MEFRIIRKWDWGCWLYYPQRRFLWFWISLGVYRGWYVSYKLDEAKKYIEFYLNYRKGSETVFTIQRET